MKVPPIIKPKKKPPLEKASEKRLKEEVAKIGGITFKFQSQNNRGVSDRIVLFNGAVYFVEMKRVGITKLSSLQSVFKGVIQYHGGTFSLVSGHDGVDKFVRDLKEGNKIKEIYK